MVQDTPYHQTVARENRCRSSHSNWPVRSLEQEVSTHPYVEAVSDRNLDRRLNIQIAPGDVRAQPGGQPPARESPPRPRLPAAPPADGYPSTPPRLDCESRKAALKPLVRTAKPS